MPRMDTRPIGIIDSSSGGLSIMAAIQSLLPHESIVYIGDHKNAPYSDKTRTFIRSRSMALIQKLIRQNCKLCIIACNTATVAGIDMYRKQFPGFPIVGVVPVIKTASAITKTNNICILSTKFTATSTYQKNLIHEFACNKKVFSLGSSKLVTYIESTKNETENITKELKKMCKTIDKKSIDVVVLGCTHYPFIAKIVSDFFGTSVSVIDSSMAVARQVGRILDKNNSCSDGTAVYQYCTTGNVKKVTQVMSRLLTSPIVVEHLTIA